MNPRIIFGITGSISAYKSLDVIRILRKKGWRVDPILSDCASQFVTPWTVETLAENAAIKPHVKDGKITHIDIAKSSDIFAICPASANTISKIASGQANELLTQTFLCFTGTRVIFPAMHTEMYENPITKQNIQKCIDQGIIVIPPDIGELASGDVGVGRLVDQSLIVQLLAALSYPTINLNRKKIVITCGGTTEHIDSVRTISNQSSGKSGHAIANYAALCGADVTLIRTKEHPTHNSIHCINVSSYDELYSALMPFTNFCDVLIMNAAVSDFKVTKSIKKISRKNLKLPKIFATDDILKQFTEQCSQHCFKIGFNLMDNINLLNLAQEKLNDKHCDLIISNGPESFGQDYRTFDIITKTTSQRYTNVSLTEMAFHILNQINTIEPQN